MAEKRKPPQTNIVLGNGFDEMFQRNDKNIKANELSIDELHHFPDHPFKLYNEEKMGELAQSISDHGVLMPILVRPREQGGYEIIAGHNRVEASRLAGCETIPATIREMDDDTAIILMIDSNLKQRETILPSERAFAYKMKLEALKRQGARTDLTSPNNLAKFRSDDTIGKGAGISGETVRLYISLTNLVPDLLNMVDAGDFQVTSAFEIASIRPSEQQCLLEIMDVEIMKPSVQQCRMIKESSQKGELDYAALHKILKQERDKQPKYHLRSERINQYLPRPDMTPKEVEETIIAALDFYRHHQKLKEAQKAGPSKPPRSTGIAR